MSKRFIYNATVLRVIDGDTIELDIDLGRNIKLRDKVRLANINSPELPTVAGKAAKEAVIAYLFHDNPTSEIAIETFKPDKYGRWLVIAWKVHPLVQASQSLNDMMVEKGFAVPYLVAKS